MPRLHLTHLAIPLTALIATVVLGITPYGTPFRTFFSYSETIRAVPIIFSGIDHANIDTNIAIKNGTTYIILKLNGEMLESASLTVSADWHLEEVRGMQAKDIEMHTTGDTTLYQLSVLSFDPLSSQVDSASSSLRSAQHDTAKSNLQAQDDSQISQPSNLQTFKPSNHQSSLELRFTTAIPFNFITFTHDSPTPVLFSLTDLRVADAENETTYQKTVQIVENEWLFAL